MLTLTELTALFGWMLIINLALFTLATVGILWLKRWIRGFHARLFQLSESQLEAQYFRYLANYKLAILVFNLAPYLALLLVG
ncbi:DUF6868 family protein [Motiliproteus sp.]|uniref:DUF6868 family protein n=1 Tax=Motiliproteus sp. TaxID=1898955 RepID=UPI003BAD5C21